MLRSYWIPVEYTGFWNVILMDELVIGHANIRKKIVWQICVPKLFYSVHDKNLSILNMCKYHWYHRDNM